MIGPHFESYPELLLSTSASQDRFNGGYEMQQDPMVLAPMSSACLFSVEKL